MTTFCEGDFVAIPLPDGREALGRILYLSSYFKDGMGFAIYAVRDALGAEDVGHLLVGDPLVLYTHALNAKACNWRVLAHRQMTDDDSLLTKRIVGGEVWVGDKELGVASPTDREVLPRMVVGGMPVVYRQIASVFVK